MSRSGLPILGSPIIRGACLLIGSLAVLLQGSSGGHMLLVEHTQCAEHGELVHNGGAHHREARKDAEADSPGFYGTSDDRPEEAHEHCALSADHRHALINIRGSERATRVGEAPAVIAT